jgi:PAS domain S-box-containing protein
MNTLNKQLAIESSQLKQLLSTSRAALLTSVILAVILAYMQREVIASSVVIAWFSLIVLVVFCRAVLVVLYQRSPVDDYSTNHIRLIRFRFGVLIAGVVWGSAGFLLFPDNDPTHQMFLVFMLAGLSAGGVISFSADFVSTMVYSIALIVPLAIRLFVAGDGLSIAMGLAVILYLGFIIISSRYIHLNLTENIVLRLEALAREDAIRASEERYRLLLNHSPVGIFHYDTNLIVTYCNSRLADILNTSANRIIGLDMKVLKDPSILPSLIKALAGEIGYYEGHYSATFSEAQGWIALTCAPSMDADGKAIGGIGIIQDVTERKQAADEIEYLAFYDSLTHLPNRRMLLDRLKHVLAASARSGRAAASAATWPAGARTAARAAPGRTRRRPAPGRAA